MSEYRKCVGIMLINSNGKVFVAERGDVHPPAWQMPQGGIDAGEIPKQAALRELKEETSITKVEIISESSKWFSYDFPDEVAKKFGGKIKGQQQKWFLMRFIGKNEDINLNTKHPEFINWKWIEPSKVIEYIVPFKRDVYKAVIDEFWSPKKI